MDLTIVLVGLLIGVGVPLRNKMIREYRKRRTETSGNWRGALEMRILEVIDLKKTMELSQTLLALSTASALRLLRESLWESWAPQAQGRPHC